MLSVFSLLATSRVFSLSASSENQRLYCTYWERCPDETARTCGCWFAGDGPLANKSDFMANYNWPSGMDHKLV